MADNNGLTVPDPSPYSEDPVPGRQRANSARSSLTPVAENGALRDFGSNSSDTPSQPRNYDGRPSIRIRRLSSVQNAVPGAYPVEGSRVEDFAPRRRSKSDPQRTPTTLPPRIAGRESYMPQLREEGRLSTPAMPGNPRVEGPAAPVASEGSSKWRPLRRAKTSIAAEKEKENEKERQADTQRTEYEEELVDLLDLVDPEVSTLQTLTNVQNSLFVPDLGRYLNRRPTYNLTKRKTQADSNTTSDDDTGPNIPSKVKTRPRPQRSDTGATLNTISSHVNESYYAVLPHGVRLPGWSEEEKLELNDHVRHMLHSRRSKFKRSMKGFKQYVSKPLGFFVTFYAVSITAFGLAWVLFLIGWINVGGSREDYLVNIIDNVLVALFAVMGDGLAPFRAIDTYHMCFIAHYHHLTWRLRREKSLPRLANDNDLPAVQPEEVVDVEKQEFSVLSPKQVEKLQHHQKKFSRSHSFYKPHETGTHYAFPLRLLVAIVVLLDCHSLLQIALGACTWGISYHVRPFALTTVILCCSITVNITAGVLITVGDHKTRKKDVKEKMIRQEMTADAIKKIEKKRRHELKAAGIIRDGEHKESALDMRQEAHEESEVLRVTDPGADALVRGLKAKKSEAGEKGRNNEGWGKEHRVKDRNDEGEKEREVEGGSKYVSDEKAI
ncbi:integral membrane protein [Diplocarpon rosae]|nr:integral membrane protein [Diplocarpon rosae]